MGRIRAMLASTCMKCTQLFAKQIRIEEAEKIHIHWNDVRILMEPEQFRTFFAAVASAVNNWDGNLSPDKDKVLAHFEFNSDIIFRDELKIELQQDGNIHFHYNDIRIEMIPDTFIALCDLFEKARRNYEKV